MLQAWIGCILLQAVLSVAALWDGARAVWRFIAIFTREERNEWLDD